MKLPFLSGDLGALVSLAEGVRLRPEDLREQIALRMQIFQALGFRAGQFVLLAHGNSHYFFLDLFALWELGLCCIPVDTQLSQPELLNLARHSGSVGLIYRKVIPHQDLQAELGGEFLWLETESLSEMPVKFSIQPDSGVDWDAPALILYTSGSTGEPKGVVHSFRSLLARLYLLRPYVPLSRLERSLNLLPTHFGHGLICNCLYPLLNGKTLILLPPFSLNTLKDLGEILTQERIRFMSSVPSLWKMALKLSAPPSQDTLELVHCGSAPLSLDLRKQIQEWTRIDRVKNTYGITETGSWLAGTEENCTQFCDGYIGEAWGSDLWVIQDQEAVIETCKPGEVGKVLVRTPALMQGYYKRPDLTQAALLNGWFQTGDLGYLDAKGRLVLVGRKRHEINRGGMKIYPEDLDLALERSPLVKEACTFAYPDEIAGQNIGVALVLTDGVDLRTVKDWFKTQISAHKMPTQWYPVAQIPKTSRGKLNRERVAQAVRP
ncbi:hypothetical protein COW36_11325 [bacterium (Candidatus Blackallbacteria) CG17_big_fil_post_rev_8_21_14_2_50_48_46]|uniref:Long-chain fatty acid--CoA ligase n=1 Tax=bacterium (Candidatus Blackallbacteria) CG17_big_fil_post_rev_8_21_14_2_50_48_46 TaxID=2014261 RepID=A0A2M7G4M0_9BACT|nr:MAG: hypothetical protein COW64_18420 [bacterium (Candidatus Blackallbacteria) CG18_big_fil_WC_8_21_14_2_50_49_26]PIW16866.1 MAG: hypothetical protein COW36_11325 [bacterium (Candidatus Blackallbacteria) CG17_big_fil_post_rev_8_21_14_2_50_48_46]PIW48063.1 MAG: hypothetical protein COW20_11040 [bacterium (Candidatus Blackallbacteria) CG13_big_fil_rev_8_21_14_2_50_49_14]